MIRYALSKTFGSLVSLGVIAAVGLENLVEVGFGLAFATLVLRGEIAFSAAVTALTLVGIVAAWARLYFAGQVLGDARIARSLSALIGMAAVQWLARGWKWLALIATGWAYVRWMGALTAMNFALALTLSLLLGSAAQLWVESAFARSLVQDETFFTALAHPPNAVLSRFGILALTGFITFVLEMSVAGVMQLFASADLPPAKLLSFTLAARVSSAVLTAWPLALGWLVRVCAFSALELAADGQLASEPPRAELVVPTV
ncbi:MAG: hypothetical protein ACT4TC_21030 [Myxococcaceae bacterium]